MMRADSRPRKPNGHELTDREQIVSKIDRALDGLVTIFGHSERRLLFAAVFRLTEGHNKRMSARMLDDLEVALRLTRKLAVELDAGQDK